MRVLQLMKSHVISASPDATLRDAVDLMDLYQISGLPVVDSEEKLVGVLTEYDIIHALLPEYQKSETSDDKTWVGLHERVERIKDKKVSEAMSAPAVSIDENMDVLQAATLILDKRIKRLPVTAGDKLVGIISRIDICQAVLEGQI
jgi:CBS domain-containing protein